MRREIKRKMCKSQRDSEKEKTPTNMLCYLVAMVI